MGTQISISKNNLYETIREVDYLTLDDVAMTIDIFREYINKDVIINGCFEDDIWQLTDEYQRVNLNFKFDELALKRSPVFKGVELNEFINYIKIYVVRLLGDYVILTIQSFIRELKEVIKSFDGKYLKSNLKLQHSYLIYDFIELIDLNNDREYRRLLIELDMISEKSIYKSVLNRRKLSTFQSYFKFDELIDIFWSGDLLDEQRIFYFPLYLWWKITTILPLRPREFLLTPRLCFQNQQNANMLTLRRTKLKGVKKEVYYSVDSDYDLYSYDVGGVLSKEIKKYISLTNDHEANELNTLFRADNHYNYFGKTKRYDSRLFSYANMKYCLSKFFSEIIKEKYNYKVIKPARDGKSISDSSDEYCLEEKSVEYINLGDTRHIAMINIVASGGTPSTAMMLAGHSSIEMSSHYFANISTLIECKTYESYKKINIIEKSKYSLHDNSKNNLLYTEKFTELDNNGRCYSMNFINGNFDDCLKIVNDSGEIGDCEKCPSYRSGNYKIFVNDKEIYTQRITDDCKYLADRLNNYRKGKGYEENVKQAILKLHNSAKSYEKYFRSNLMNGGQ